MSSIRNTITETLQAEGHGSYISYAEGVISALEEREESIKEGLLSYAGQRGLSDAEVRNLFIQVGLTEPEPEPEVAVEPQSVEAMLASLGEKIDSITSRLDSASQQAARHGIRF